MKFLGFTGELMSKAKTVLKKVVKYVAPVLIIGFMGVVYIIYNPPAFLIELIRKQAEIQVLKATDLYTSVDKITKLRLGLFKQTAVAEGITILKNNTTTAPKFLTSNTLEINFNVLSFFLFGPEKSTLELKIVKPVVDMNRNKKGEFDIDSPLFQPKEKKEEKKSEIPRILFTLDQGMFNYTDDTFANKLIVNARIPIVHAEIQNSVYVKFDGELYNNKDYLNVKGTFNTETGQTKLASKVQIENMSRWVNIFYNVSKGNLILRNGSVNLDVNASWDSFKLANLQFSSTGNAKNLIGKFPYYNNAVNIENLAFNLDQNKINLKDLTINTLGSTLKAQLESAYNGDNTYVKANIRGDDLNIGQIINAVDKTVMPENVRQLGITGIGNVDLNLDGYYPKLNKKLAFISYPEKFQPRTLDGKLDIKNGTIYGANIDQVNTKVFVNKNDARLKDFYLKAYDGKVTGNLSINKLFKGELGKTDVKNAVYLGDFKVDKINVGKVLTDFKDPVPMEYKPYGVINGNVKVAGKLNDPLVKAKVYSPQLTFNSKYSQFRSIDDLYADIDYSKQFIAVNTKLNSYDFGKTFVDFKMKNQDRITVKTTTDNLRLSSVSQFIPNVDITSGLLDGNVFADFSLKALRQNKKLTPEQITNLINAKGNVNFSGVNLLYRTKKSPFTLTNTSGDFYLNMGQGDIVSRLNLNSNETGIVNANVALNDLDILNAKISTVSFPLKKIEPFVPNLYVKSGLVSIKSNINTSLKALTSKNLSADQLIAYINTDSKVKLINGNLLYKANKPFTLSSANADMYIKSNGRDLNSTLALTSYEYGKTDADIFVNDLNNFNARINVNNLRTKTITAFVPKLNSNIGTVNASANITGSLNQIRFSKLPITSLISTKAKINVNDADFAYALANKKYINSTNTNADAYLSLKNGNLASEVSFISDQFGQGNLISSLKNFDTTYARLDVSNIPSKTLESFVPNLKVNSGNGDLKLTVNTKLSELSKEPSLDRLTYILAANADINFRNNNLVYGKGKSAVEIDNGLANVRFDMQKGIVKSTYLFSSSQFGKLVGFLDVDKNRNVVGTFSNDTLDLRNVGRFIPNAKIERGLGRFNLAVAGNIRKFTEDPGAIIVRGGINVDDLIASFNSKGKVYPIEIASLRNTFNYTGGTFKTDLSVLSKDIGNLTAYANLDGNGKLNGKIYSRNIKLASVDKFINSPNLDINNGILALNINFNGNFSDLMDNYLAFNADGDLRVNDFNMVYIDEKTTEKVKSEDGKTVEQPRKINQGIDRIALDFNWKKGILGFDNINLKENNSELVGKGSLNIDRFLNGSKAADNGRVTINSKNFKFSDFPITQLANIKDGSVENLELVTNLPHDMSDLKLTLNSTIKGLNFNDQTNIDTIFANLNIDKNVINLKNVSLFQAENYLKAKGIVNIANMNNPKFDVNLNSRRFPLKAIFAAIPESVLNRTKSGGTSNTSTKNLKLTYKLPVRNNYATRNKTINVNDLIAYWEQWALEPLTEEDAKNQQKLAPVWKSIDGELSVNADLKGDTLEPVAKIDLLVSNGNIYGRKINEIFLKADYEDGTINLPNFHFIEEEGGYLVASGSMLQSGKINLEADGKLNLNWSKSFMKDDNVDVEGDTVLAIDVKGTITNPDVSLSLDAERGGVFNNVHFDDLVFIGTYKNKIAALNDVRLVSGGKEAKASGIIPIDESLGSMNVSLGLSGESLGLVNLFTREIEWLKGSGDAFINVQGSISDPLLNGKLNIQDAEVYVASLGRPIEKLNVDIDLSNHFVKINRADTFLNQGKVSLLGQLDLIGFKPGFLKLKLFADDFRWEQDNINLGGKLSLNINNTVTEPLIGGKIQVTKGEMTFGLGRSGSSKDGASAKPKKKAKASIDTQFNNLRIEIPKETDLWVRSPFFDLRPYGNLNLKSGSITSPEIQGFAAIDRGNLYIINNEFKITEATATFGGKDFDKEVFPINPKLNIVADTQLMNPRSRQNVDVEAKITGDLEDIPENKVQINWTKTGGLTEAEIWSQVVGLDAAQELVQNTGSGNATTIAKFATPYFNRALFNPLTSKVADFLSLDEFSLGIASDAITNPGVSLAISKPLIGGLSIGYQGTIRTSNIAQYNFFTRYRFDNGLSIRAAVDERNAASLQGEYGFGF